MKSYEADYAMIRVLRELYELKSIGKLMEFCQGEMRILLYLYAHAQEVVYPSLLSYELSVSRQRITSILTALRKKGYISMQPEENDRRRVRISLTATGMAFVAKKQTAVEAFVSRFISDFGSENVQQFIADIDRAVHVLRNYELQESE